jgi:ketosteroid isomerase-like protein
MSKLTAEQVRSEVNRFWSTFSTKAEEKLGDFYAPNSSVFGSDATRTEPGRLAATRRKREYFQEGTSVHVSLSPIEVTLLGDNVAVAAYTFRFEASHVHHGLGQEDEDIQHGRATQVFTLEPDGRLLIVHEHLSAVKG